jgi:hypothetical protein
MPVLFWAIVVAASFWVAFAAVASILVFGCAFAALLEAAQILREQY